MSLIGDIGRRVGLAIDNTLRFGRQRQIAEAMQRNLLASLPQPGRLRLAARYQPAPRRLPGRRGLVRRVPPA
ncbi:hypothetical protein [Nonomuraea salmonea]|uniref:hypothetical protein n=1 Tax=Nonomuraea salmonea TaxID=46181 RepID=UPI0031F030E3